MNETERDDLEHSIAVIGMAGRFPGARDLDEFWQNLRDGVESISFLTDEELAAAEDEPELVADPHYVKACPMLEDADLFDASFFDYSPREAEILDPQSRLFLECAWQALERAGYVAEDYEGWIGVFAGSSASSYQYNLLSRPEVLGSVGWFQIYLANDRDYFTTRVSYKLNLKGPSVNVQTACSTSLVAVYQACQSLLEYQCTVALAGGVRLAVPQNNGYLYEPGGVLSPDGHCRAFDARGAGSIFGNGVGVVALKRLDEALADGDPIEAVIRGSSINNDGSTKVGFTAPSAHGQAEAVAMAHSVAGIDPEKVSYVETHGSGTPLGDPIEVSALTDAFRAATDRTAYCAIGSVKSNFGHLEAAAGVAGLIKTILALKHRQIPPSLHYETPNPEIDFGETPFYVNAELRPWESNSGPRLAGVSSFGMGGTNVHAIVEEAPEREPSGPSRPWQLLLLSARTDTALETATDDLAGFLERQATAPLADVAYTLQTGRRSFEVRRMALCRDPEDARAALAARDPERVFTQRPAATGRPVAFLLPGLGEHYVDMGRGLYRSEPLFRGDVDRSAEILRPLLGRDLREVLFRPDEPGEGDSEGGLDLARMLGRGRSADDEAGRQLNETRYAQPAVFVVEHALARLWMSWGIRPQALIGHSLGEYTAACLAGVLSLEDALLLVAERARLIHRQPPGAMLAVPFTEDRLASYLGEGLSLAAVNAPEVSVASGPVGEIDALERRLSEEGTACQRLPTTHAFHSRMMQPVARELEATLRQVRLEAPEIPYLSNVTGRWITAEEATDPAYWTRHLVEPVRFDDGVAELLREDGRVLLEVGPGRGLGALVLQRPRAASADGERVVLSSLRVAYDRRDDQAFALETLGRLWLAGVRPGWAGFYDGETRHRLALPTYPFERRRFWIDPPGQPSRTAAPVPQDGAAPETAPSAPESLALHDRPDLPTPYAAPETELEERLAAVWQEVLGIGKVGVHDSYFDMGGHSLLAPRLLLKMRQAVGVELSLEVLVNAPTVARLGQVVEQARQEGDAALAVEAVDLHAEIALDDEIRAVDPTPAPSWSAPSAVFLTGGSGFLGAFLLHALLEQTDATVYCLARADNDAAARDRLRRNLEHYQVFEAQHLARIEPVAGDLGRPLFGLSWDAFDELAGRVDVVLHAGAWVNFTYPYRALKSANVHGTREALRLAARKKVKPFHFVSSTAVFAPGSFNADGLVFEDDALEHTEGLFSGYAETKWVCEKVVGLARDRGIPAAVYRPGVIGGHSRTGAGNTSDLVWNILKGCIQMGACVKGFPAFDVAPADYVGGGIVHLLRQPSSLGQAFHFPNPRPASWDDVFDWARSMGYALIQLGYEEWRQELVRIAASAEDNALVPFLPLLDAPVDDDAEPLAEGEIRGQAHDGTHTSRALAASPVSCPPVDADLIRTYVRYFVETGFLSPPPADPP